MVASPVAGAYYSYPSRNVVLFQFSQIGPFGSPFIDELHDFIFWRISRQYACCIEAGRIKRSD
jgi:hypothetical protein